jgi:AraC family transcriptional regulator
MTDLAASLAPADDPLDRARLHIDAKLFEPLSLGQLADAAGLSAYHFTRQFGARFGASPMAYVRARRLTAAADRLCGEPSPALIDLAFDCGFDSQEGFTRAFKRAFGVPPGRYRRVGARSSSTESPAMNDLTDVRITLTQAPAPVRKAAMRIAGLAAVFDDTNKAGIPKLWDRLVPLLPFKGQIGAETFGVCCAAPPGSEPGSMRYMAGGLIALDAPAPDGLEIIDLAPQTYLVFRQTMDGSAVHPQMQAATKAIWGERVPKSGRRLVQAPDLEFYPADSTPDQAGAWVEWWVPVEA